MLAVLAGTAAPGAPADPPPRIAIVVMENKEAPTALSGSYLKTLAKTYAVATRSYGVTHPSLPNYLALTSGSTHGVTDDGTDYALKGRNLVDQLEDAGASWRAYMESMPRRCFAGPYDGLYAKKHNPFAYYRSVMGDPDRCRKVVPLRSLRLDRLPTFLWISPNLCSDTHDCEVDHGDRWLRRNVAPLIRALGPGGYLVITYDEGATSAGCCGGSDGGRIATVVAGPGARRGARMAKPVDQYGVLRTIEDSLGLPRLGAARDGRHGSLAPLLDAAQGGRMRR